MFLVFLLQFNMLFTSALVANPQQEPSTTASGNEHYPFNINLLKIYPSFWGLKFTGGTIAYETGLWWPYLTGAISARYSPNINLTTSRDTIVVPAFWRFELSPRYYPFFAFNGLFAEPALSFYNNGEIGGSIVMGYQFHLSKKFLVEAFAGVAKKPSFESRYNSPIIPKVGIGAGISFGKDWGRKRKTTHESEN